MRKSEIEFTENLFKKIIGEDRKYKIFNGKMYVSLGNNRVAYIELSWPTPEKNYGWDAVDISVFDKTHGRIDSIKVNFEDVCERTKFQDNARNYFVSCNKNRWFEEEPPEEVFELIHNYVENYLEIFGEEF